MDTESAQYQGTRSVVATLPDELRARLQKVSVDAYRALRVRDYGRVDLRLTDTVRSTCSRSMRMLSGEGQ